MDFYASLTINHCHLKRLCGIWVQHYPDNQFPFRCAMISPLFAPQSVLREIYRHRKQCSVMFDSGGFHVQQGRIALSAATRQLQIVYRENDWADRFVLPDSPIISLDSDMVIRYKLNSTRRQYRNFPIRFSDAFRRKLLPVIHGTTPKEIFQSVKAAETVGSKSLGFGGFSTSGPNGGVNSFSAETLRLLVLFSTLCKERGLSSHAFGIGGPAAIVVLRHAFIKTFDSAGWIRTAAYGNVYLPYVGALNITGAAASRRYFSKQEFLQLSRASAHSCPFCSDYRLLARSWPHRALHNYCTIMHAAQQSNTAAPLQDLAQLRLFNPRFARYLEFVLAERSRLRHLRANRASVAAY